VPSLVYCVPSVMDVVINVSVLWVEVTMIQTFLVCFVNLHTFPAAMWAWLQDAI